MTFFVLFTIMALDRSIRNQENNGGSVYDDRGVTKTISEPMINLLSYELLVTVDY